MRYFTLQIANKHALFADIERASYMNADTDGRLFRSYNITNYRLCMNHYKNCVIPRFQLKVLVFEIDFDLSNASRIFRCPFIALTIIRLIRL